MSATTLLSHLTGINPRILSKEEHQILEINLFSRLCEELKETHKIEYKDYFRTIRLNTEMESHVLETNFLRHIINDILSTGEYSLEGIVYYTQAHEEIILDIATGKNTDPALSLVRKIIDLHRSVRPHLYQMMIDKIMRNFSEEKSE